MIGLWEYKIQSYQNSFRPHFGKSVTKVHQSEAVKQQHPVVRGKEGKALIERVSSLKPKHYEKGIRIVRVNYPINKEAKQQWHQLY